MPQTKKDPLYLAQEEACKLFFKAKYPIREIEKPDELEYNNGEDGKVYDITGLRAIEVIAAIIAIINDPSKWPTKTSKVKKTFYFLIRPKNDGDDVYRVFKLKARPTEHQPGNGVVSIMYLQGERYQARRPKAYSTLIKDLFKAKTSPGKFTEVIQMLFKDNSEITQDDTAIAEMYFLLLFEIARRRSNEKKKTEEAKRLDTLPIGSAIARIIKMLGATDKKEDPECLKEILELYCHCFETHSSAREKTIMNLNSNTANTSRINLTNLQLCMKELEEMYCTPRVAKKLYSSYYWSGSLILRELEGFVESRIQVKFLNENRKVLMNCKYNEAKRRWTVNFTNRAECIALENKFFKTFTGGDCESLEFERCMNWHGTFDSLKRYLNETLKLEGLKGKWSKHKFVSPTLTIDCEYDPEEEYWGIVFQGVENKKTVEERFLQIQFGENFTVKNVQGDGACFFRAVSHQLHDDEERHSEIRKAGIRYINSHRCEFEGFLDTTEYKSIDEYTKKMSKGTKWCDHIIMTAVAKALKIAIRVIQPGSCDFVLGQNGQNRREIRIGYIHGNHYVSLKQLT